jgi:hypothetical protein
MPEADKTATVESSFKPKIIENMQMTFLKEDERGRFYVLRNLENSRYIRVHESLCKIIRMLNGINTVADIEKEIHNENLPLDVQELLTLLAQDGFIENLKGRLEKQEEEYHTFKIKFFSLDATTMDKLVGPFSIVRSRLFKIFYILFCIGGLILFFSNIRPIFSDVIEVWKPQTSLLPLLIGIALAYLVTFIHEMSHAVAYHSLGGKSVNMGVEFHFMMPFFYTDTPDARGMAIRDGLKIFLAGPLSTLLCSAVFAYLFALDKRWAPLWAFCAFSFSLVTVLSIIPILNTDGYLVAQSVLKFPNLMPNGISVITEFLKLITRRISMQDYKNYLSQFSQSERRILVVYTICFIVTIIVLIYTSVVLALLFSFVDVFSLTPQVIIGKAPYIKEYFLWIVYVASLAISLIGAVGTLIHATHKAKRR